MKVAVVVDESTVDHGREYAFRYWGRLVPELQSRCEHVAFITIRHFSDEHETLRAAGLDVEALGVRSSLAIPKGVLRLRRLLRDKQINIVHGDEVIAAFMSGLASRAPMRSVFFRHHSIGSHRLQFASRMAARVNDAILTASSAVWESAWSLDQVEPGRLITVNHGTWEPRRLDEAEVHDKRSTLGVGRDDFLVAAIARLSPVKGIDTLISAFSRLDICTDRHARLLIAGDGPEKENLIDLATRLSISERVHFIGHQTAPDDIYQVADVVVMPSYREPFGKVAIEAMACGATLIASRVGGLQEIVTHESNGLLVPPGDATALKEALCLLMSDREEVRRLGHAARKTYEHRFTIDSMVEGWIQAYQAVADGTVGTALS